jgi:hypothetical protein
MSNSKIGSRANGGGGCSHAGAGALGLPLGLLLLAGLISLVTSRRR